MGGNRTQHSVKLQNTCSELFETKSFYELESVPYQRCHDNEKQVDRPGRSARATLIVWVRVWNNIVFRLGVFEYQQLFCHFSGSIVSANSVAWKLQFCAFITAPLPVSCNVVEVDAPGSNSYFESRVVSGLNHWERVHVGV